MWFIRRSVWRGGLGALESYIYLISVYKHVCHRECVVKVRGQLVELVLPVIMWVPGIEFRSSGLAASAFNY